MTQTDNIARATIAVFNATATEEQRRLRDAIAAAYGIDEAPPPPPTVNPPRTGYGSVKAAIIADLRAHPRSTSADIFKRIGIQPPNVAELARRGGIVREDSGRTNNAGNTIYLYSAKDSE